mgnify:CR=1 FL=1
MKKPFIVANVREVLGLYDNEEISFSRMVEMLNEIAEKFYVGGGKEIVFYCDTAKYAAPYFELVKRAADKRPEPLIAKNFEIVKK